METLEDLGYEKDNNYYGNYIMYILSNSVYRVEIEFNKRYKTYTLTHINNKTGERNGCMHICIELHNAIGNQLSKL